MIHKKLLSLLVLLMTAASGAWADGTWTSGGCTLKLEGTTLTVSKNTSGQMADYTYYYERGWNNDASSVTSLVIEEGVTYLGKSAFGMFTKITEVTIPSTVTSIGQYAIQQCYDLKTVTVKAASCTLGFRAFDLNSKMEHIYVPSDKVTDYKNAAGWSAYESIIEAAPVIPGEMTLNAAKTEATMESMPDYDVTVDYELVRDMNDETYPVAFSGLPEPAADTGVAKIVVKKNSSSGKFEFLNAITIALIDPLAATGAQNIIEADGITIKVLKGTENISGAIDYDQDNPIALDAFLADTQPGYYWIKAVPTDETTSPYIGTVYSSELLLIKGYEVTVPAGEYITYYRDEPLYADPVSSTDAQLYTITSVSTTDGTATLSDAIATAPSSTPLLVYNSNTSEDKTFLLIPADAEPNLALTVAPEFIGTTEATTIAASTTTVNNYALNGKQFVWVKNAIAIAANKAWLSVTTGGSLHARSLTLTFGDATGVNEVIEVNEVSDDTVYDLNGRKLNAAPTRKGVYIKNGQKVVIK